MARKKMIPPLPESFGVSERERFRRFATGVLAVHKSEVMPADEMLAKLEAQRRQIDTKIEGIRNTLAKANRDSADTPVKHHDHIA